MSDADFPLPLTCSIVLVRSLERSLPPKPTTREDRTTSLPHPEFRVSTTRQLSWSRVSSLRTFPADNPPSKLFKCLKSSPQRPQIINESLNNLVGVVQALWNWIVREENQPKTSKPKTPRPNVNPKAVLLLDINVRLCFHAKITTTALYRKVKFCGRATMMRLFYVSTSETSEEWALAQSDGPKPPLGIFI